MISSLAPGGPTPSAPSRTPSSALAPRKSVTPAASSLSTPAEAIKAQALRKVGELRERLRLLSMLIELDRQASVRMMADIARELKAAVKAYRDAGGAERDLPPALSTARLSPDEGRADDPDMPSEAPADPIVLAEREAAYARVVGAEAREGREADHIADQGALEQFRMVLAGLREARDKVRAAALSPGPAPDDDDWKTLNTAQTEVERLVDGFAADVDGEGLVLHLTA